MIMTTAVESGISFLPPGDRLPPSTSRDPDDSSLLGKRKIPSEDEPSRSLGNSSQAETHSQSDSESQESSVSVDSTRKWAKKWVEVKTITGTMKVLRWATDEQRLLAGPHSCSLCFQEFPTLSLLKKHVKTHGDDKFICVVEECGKTFQDHESLKEHQKAAKHEMVPKKHSSSTSESTPVKKGSFNGEIKLSPNAKSFQTQLCLICKKTLSCAGSLRKHIRRHDQPNSPCVVESCSLIFNDPFKFHKHISTDHPDAVQKAFQELKDTPIPCEYCGRIYANMTALKKHSRIHAEKKFICPSESCDEKFLDNYLLQRHIKSMNH